MIKRILRKIFLFQRLLVKNARNGQKVVVEIIKEVCGMVKNLKVKL